MKKWIAFLLVLAMIGCMVGCGQQAPAATPTDAPAAPVENQDQPAGNDNQTVAAPEAPFIELTGTMPTAAGDAEVIFTLGANGYYIANASHQYGSLDFASGTWAMADGNIVLTDVNGTTYTSTSDGTTCTINGVWDVGSQVGQEVTVTAPASILEGASAGNEAVSAEPAAPEAPFLEFLGTMPTAAGDAEVVFTLGSNGYYMANASHQYGSLDFASGSWEIVDGNVVLTDVNGTTYTSTTDGTTCTINGVWDVGSQVGQEVTVTAAEATVASFGK